MNGSSAKSPSLWLSAPAPPFAFDFPASRYVVFPRLLLREVLYDGLSPVPSFPFISPSLRDREIPFRYTFTFTTFVIRALQIFQADTNPPSVCFLVKVPPPPPPPQTLNEHIHILQYGERSRITGTANLRPRKGTLRFRST